MYNKQIIWIYFQDGNKGEPLPWQRPPWCTAVSRARTAPAVALQHEMVCVSNIRKHKCEREALRRSLPSLPASQRSPPAALALVLILVLVLVLATAPFIRPCQPASQLSTGYRLPCHTSPYRDRGGPGR